MKNKRHYREHVEDYARLRQAATLIICKLPENERKDPEVLMLKRNRHLNAWANVHCFPGGKLEAEADGHSDWESIGFGLSREKHGSDIPKIADHGHHHSLYLRPSMICAVRETFEETGVLLCEPPVNWESPSAKHEWRQKVHTNPMEFIKLCRHYKTTPALHQLRFWQNWTTPDTEPRRFNTLFFMAVIPASKFHHQDSSKVKNSESTDTLEVDKWSDIDENDDGFGESETVSWFTPKQALEKFESEEIELVIPQIYTMFELFTACATSDYPVRSFLHFYENRMKLWTFDLRIHQRNSHEIVHFCPEYHLLDLEPSESSRKRKREKHSHSCICWIMPGDALHSALPGPQKARHRILLDMQSRLQQFVNNHKINTLPFHGILIWKDLELLDMYALLPRNSADERPSPSKL